MAVRVPWIRLALKSMILLMAGAHYKSIEDLDATEYGGGRKCCFLLLASCLSVELGLQSSPSLAYGFILSTPIVLRPSYLDQNDDWLPWISQACKAD